MADQSSAFSHRVVFPRHELSGFVSHFWHSQWHTGIQEHFVHHSTASTSTDMVFAFAQNGGKRELVFCSAQGHTDKFRSIEAGGISDMFGVTIYSHAMPFFFDVSAPDFASQLINLDEIIRIDLELILHRVSACNDIHAFGEIMSSYLMQNFNSYRATDTRMMNSFRRLRQAGGLVRMSDLVDDASLSQKQFERRFKAFTGFNPKLYSRILRFESSLSATYENKRLLDTALDLGYYDHAHFINDFRKFSGSTPGKYTPISQ